MKRTTPLKKGLCLAAIAAIGPLASAQAGSFFADFNDGAVPTNATVYGNAQVLPSGGYTNSGFLELTAAASGQNAAFIINDLDTGVPVVSFTASYKCLIGGGGYTGADGISFNFSPDLPADVITEEGAGSGLTVEFDTFDNGAPDTAPSIDVKVGGAEVITSVRPNGIRTGSDWVDVVIQLNPDNSLTVIYGGAYVYSNLDLTAYGYAPTGGSQFGFGARTGGSFDNQWIDNLSITTSTIGQPYLNSFAPQGSAVATNSPIDIVLTDNTTQVDTNKIVLKLDGAIVPPSITQDGAGDTFIHYAKPGGFRLASTHTVSVTFSDNATTIPHTNTWAYGFAVVPPNFVPGAYVAILSDGFENYVSGNTPLDMNYAAANANANGNLAGNPWFGPAPPNARVVGSETGVTPHGGTNMITGSAPSDGDQNWYNIIYRLRGGQPVYGNCMLDWWFYDPSGSGDSGYRDNVALINYSTVPTGTDYPGTGSLNAGATVYQRATLGAANNTSAGYDNMKYQARNVSGPTGYTGGWNNLGVTRSVGWHHGRIIAGPATNNVANLYYYIDDMVVPAFSQLNTSSRGFNAIEINSGQNATLGYFDDVSFALAVPPKLVATRSGNNVTFSWPGGFNLQSASDVRGPYTDIAAAPLQTYSYDTTSSPKQFFRLRN